MTWRALSPSAPSGNCAAWHWYCCSSLRSCYCANNAEGHRIYAQGLRAGTVVPIAGADRGYCLQCRSSAKRLPEGTRKRARSSPQPRAGHQSTLPLAPLARGSKPIALLRRRFLAARSSLIGLENPGRYLGIKPVLMSLVAHLRSTPPALTVTEESRGNRFERRRSVSSLEAMLAAYTSRGIVPGSCLVGHGGGASRKWNTAD